jgi:hypothetical protein
MQVLNLFTALLLEGFEICEKFLLLAYKGVLYDALELTKF